MNRVAAKAKRILSFFNNLGPGLLLAATCIGASHLVMAPEAGQKFGFQLLWLVLLTHVFKYHAFEFGPRYAAATGESLIAGYMRMRGPKGWALWIFLFGTIAQGIGVLASVAGIAASVLHTFLGVIDFSYYAAIVIGTVLLFLFVGGYGWLDFLNKIMMAVLFVVTIMVFVPECPEPAKFVNFVKPSIPLGSIVIIAGILGWMPTGIDVSVWHSLWTLEKHPELRLQEGAKSRLGVLRMALADMRIGYVLSFIVAAVFLMLAASSLHGTDNEIAGVGFSKSLANIYVKTMGAWMFPVFMIAAFFAMYSTTYTVMDGFGRCFGESVATLFPELDKSWRGRLYRIFVLFTAVLAFGLIITVGNPVTLVGIVAIVSFAFAPLYYGLNYYCVTRFIKDKQFKPKRAARVTALTGIAVMFGASLLCIGTGLNKLMSRGEVVELSGEVLRDKIRGGLLGQMLGNLNGLEHEMTYIGEPGNVSEYVPSLPEGAWTDDDTDFEWVYVLAMGEHDTVFIPPAEIAGLWKERINKRIWCSNQYARQLMDLGFEPPRTGNVVLNPWAEFNISGQFLCETFGLMGPGMPQTAGRIGLHYTTVAIDGEPAQTTQLFCAMIATAFVTDDMEAILDAGVASVDEASVIRQVVGDVRKWHGEEPDDWRAVRGMVKEKYSLHGGAMRDKNGYELNTASIVAALLYGEGDLCETLRIAFNFGWDADCNAATAGTIVGVVKGYDWMMGQGWDIVDRYRNTTRENMPMDETITSFGERVMELAERVIVEGGGQRRFVDGRVVYRIRREEAGNVAPLASVDDLVVRMQEEMRAEVEEAILRGVDDVDRARGAYLAICLDLAGGIKSEYPAEWVRAVEALENNSKVVQVLFHHSPVPLGERLRAKALEAGVKKPAQREKIW